MYLATSNTHSTSRIWGSFFIHQSKGQFKFHSKRQCAILWWWSLTGCRLHFYYAGHVDFSDINSLINFLECVLDILLCVQIVLSITKVNSGVKHMTAYAISIVAKSNFIAKNGNKNIIQQIALEKYSFSLIIVCLPLDRKYW